VRVAKRNLVFVSGCSTICIMYCSANITNSRLNQDLLIQTQRVEP